MLKEHLLIATNTNDFMHLLSSVHVQCVFLDVDCLFVCLFAVQSFIVSMSDIDMLSELLDKSFAKKPLVS